MSLLLLLVALAVIGGIAVVAAGRWGSMAEIDPDRSLRGVLPADAVDREGVEGLRFTLALRGYRMDEVDDVIDQLVAEIDRRGERIAELEFLDSDESAYTEIAVAGLPASEREGQVDG